MKLRRKKKIFLCMLFAIMLLNINVYNVKADTGGGLEQGSEASGGSDHQLCPTCKITSSESYPFGYRIYTTDHAGSVLSRTNVLNQASGTIKMFEGFKVRSEAAGADVPKVVGSDYKPGSGLGFTGWYSGTPANFDVVVKLQLGLNKCHMGGNIYRIPRANGTCPETVEDMNDPEYVSHMLGVLNTFFANVGLSQNAESLYEKWKTASTEDEAYIYLAAEGLLSFKQSGIFYAGTCTEHAYWLQAQGDTNQNRVLAELCATATLKNFDGAGYYYMTDQFNKEYANYTDTKWVYARTGNKRDGLTSGISTFVWRISDLFGPNKCATLSDQEICNKDNWEDCCSCTKAAQLEAEGNGEYVSDDAKDEYRRTLNYPACSQKMPDEIPTCDYELDVKIPTACATTKSGKVSDKADWDCIFVSDNDMNDSSVQTNYKSSFSNEYCAVYCQEEINYNMPGSGTTVTAGSWFELGSYSGDGVLGPISYQGIKTCRPTDKANSQKGEINVQKFLDDMKTLEEQIINAWDAWQYAELQNKVILAGKQDKKITKCCGCCNRHPCPTEKNKNKTCCDPCQTDTCYTYIYKNEIYTTYYGDEKDTNISDGSGHCSGCGNVVCDDRVPLKNITPLRNKYKELVRERDAKIAEIRKCSSYYDKYDEFKPTVNFYYKDSMYEQTVTLKGTGVATSKSNYFKFGNAASSPNVGTSGKTETHSGINNEATGGIPTYSADGTVNKGYTMDYAHPTFGGGKWDCGDSVTYSTCTSRLPFKYPTNVWWEQKTTRTYSFVLPDTVDGKPLNAYIDKPSGYSSNTETANYTYIGKSNLPVHYSTNPDTYDYKVMVTSFGPNDKFTKYVINGSPFNKVNYQKDTTYICNYTVECQKTIVCTPSSCDPSCDSSITGPSGTDLIYRTISLYYPFPGENATTTSLRAPGWNWQTSMSYDPVTSYIYQNRGVDYYEVYRLDPMYEVNLTPSLMRKIREYNKQQEDESGTFYVGSNVPEENKITGKLGYSDFTLTCKDDGSGSKASECTSAVIRSWGVKGCAISGSSGYSNCGNTVAW